MLSGLSSAVQQDRERQGPVMPFISLQILYHTWDSIDMADALHPQTFLCYDMNGSELPVAHGGLLRMRLPRQIGYKNIKFITRLTVTDNLKRFGKGLGSAAAEAGYAWYTGI